jgi:lipopolysaccharide cholinephosphotransferase
MSTYRSREIMERHYWGTPKSYQFENIEVKGPEMADEYLTHLFRNWRELPPVDKRQSAHDFIELDLNKSYLSD